MRTILAVLALSACLVAVLRFALPVAAPIVPEPPQISIAISELGNPLQPSPQNDEQVKGVDRIRLFGPWRAKDSGTLLEGFADLEGGDAAQSLRLVVYALRRQPDGYAPGILVATSNPITLAAKRPRGWVRFSFPEGAAVARDTRYALGVWFAGEGDAALWVESRIGSRWNIAVEGRAPTDLALDPFTGRDEGLPGLYATLRVLLPPPPPAGMVRLSPGELPASVPVTNPLSGAHRWRKLNVISGLNEATAYQRYTWDEVEGDTPGSYDWSPIRKDMREARARGQMYAFRVRARVTAYEVPAYLEGRTFNDPYFRERHAALHRAIRAEFENDPDIAWVDLDGPGDWGEWRNGDWNSITPEARADVVRYLAEIWKGARIPTLMFSVGETELSGMRERYPASGIRNEIWGGEGAGALMWSEQAQDERMAILDSGERNLLLGGEIDSGISDWSVRSLHQQILWLGPHTIGNGNFKAESENFSRFSAAEQAELRAAYGKLGYRLVVAGVDVPRQIAQNTPASLTFYWHNRNVTVPVAKDVGKAYLLLVDRQGREVASYPLAVDVQSLRPTGAEPHVRREQITVRGLAAGDYTLRLRVVMLNGRTMNLANAGRTADGAYPLGTVTVLDAGMTPPDLPTADPLTPTAGPYPYPYPYPYP